MLSKSLSSQKSDFGMNLVQYVHLPRNTLMHAGSAQEERRRRQGALETGGGRCIIS